MKFAAALALLSCPLAVVSGTNQQACGVDKHTVEVTVVTDDYPGETSWEVENVLAGHVVQESEAFDLHNHEYKSSFCVEKTAHKFTVYDDFGDGIEQPGYYELRVDGVLTAEGSAIGYEHSTKFGNTPAPPPTPTSPRTPAQGSGCGGDELSVEVLVVTDDYPEETSWRIESHETGNTIKESDTYDEHNKEYRVSFCLIQQPYRFVISDSFGDGIDLPGKYELRVDGVVVDEGFDFGSETGANFGN